MVSVTATRIAAVLALCGSGALAQDLEAWGSASGWDVMIDASLGDGCLIQAQYQDGSTVRVGFDRNAGGGYVAAFNDNWYGVETGAIYDVGFDLDGQPYSGEAEGLYLDDVPGVFIPFDNPDFLWDIASKYTMTLYNEDTEVMAIDLEGSYNALDFAVECQEEIG